MSLACGSPMIVIQVALFTYMTIYGIKATFQGFSNNFLSWTYAIGIVVIYVL